MKSELVVASFPKCNRDHSQARPLGTEGAGWPLHHTPSPERNQGPRDTKEELAWVAVEPRRRNPGGGGGTQAVEPRGAGGLWGGMPTQVTRH